MFTMNNNTTPLVKKKIVPSFRKVPHLSRTWFVYTTEKHTFRNTFRRNQVCCLAVDNQSTRQDAHKFLIHEAFQLDTQSYYTTTEQLRGINCPKEFYIFKPSQKKTSLTSSDYFINGQRKEKREDQERKTL